MTAGLTGDLSRLRSLERSIRALPLVVAQKVAAASAGTITTMARATFDAGENAYGDTWLESAEGKRVTLHRTGGLESGVGYVATGTRLWARLGPKYSRYQVGPRPVFPRAGARLPVRYVEALAASTSAVIRGELGTR